MTGPTGIALSTTNPYVGYITDGGWIQFVDPNDGNRKLF